MRETWPMAQHSEEFHLSEFENKWYIWSSWHELNLEISSCLLASKFKTLWLRYFNYTVAETCRKHLTYFKRQLILQKTLNCLDKLLYSHSCPTQRKFSHGLESANEMLGLPSCFSRPFTDLHARGNTYGSCVNARNVFSLAWQNERSLG